MEKETKPDGLIRALSESLRELECEVYEDIPCGEELVILLAGVHADGVLCVIWEREGWEEELLLRDMPAMQFLPHRPNGSALWQERVIVKIKEALLKNNRENEPKKTGEKIFRLLFPRQKEEVRDGQRFVGRTDRFGRQTWVPVNEETDPDEHALLTALYGCFGIHKFKEGRIGAGLFYLGTFGCFGVLPFLDILSMLWGNYRLKDESVLERLQRKGRAFACLPAAALIGIFLAFGVKTLVTSRGVVTWSRLDQEESRGTLQEIAQEYSDILSELAGGEDGYGQ